MPEVLEEGKVMTSRPEDNKNTFNISSNPFGDGVPAPKETVVAPEKIIDGHLPAAATETDTVDADEFLAKETGWKTWDEAKAAKTELETLKAKKPDEFKFANAESEKYFNAIKEGKEDDIYSIIQSKKQLERAEKMDASKPKDAAEIIKLDLLYKNKDLSQDDVDFLFSEKYEAPEKPDKADDMDDDDYNKKVAKWEKQVELVNKRMVIDAKLAKPELSKFKSELVLPDIPKAEPQAQGPTQEVLDAQKAMRDNYLHKVESDFSKFDGFNTKFKNEDVDEPVSYQVHADEKAAIKKLMQEMDVNEYFGTRWFDEKGNAKVERMMADLYFLENPQKVLDGIAEKAASAKFKGVVKANSNIRLNGGGSSNQTNLQEPVSRREKEVAAIWSA
jgi:hypothetical protein